MSTFFIMSSSSRYDCLVRHIGVTLFTFVILRDSTLRRMPLMPSSRLTLSPDASTTVLVTFRCSWTTSRTGTVTVASRLLLLLLLLETRISLRRSLWLLIVLRLTRNHRTAHWCWSSHGHRNHCWRRWVMVAWCIHWLWLRLWSHISSWHPRMKILRLIIH